MDFFQKLFAAMSSEDSIAFLFFITCAFLLGFLIAALGWGARARRRKKELKQLKRNYEDLQIEHERLQEQIDLKQADLIRAEREAEESTAMARAIEKEKETLNLEIATLTEENSKLTELTQTYSTNIEALNNQIIGLKTRNNQLSTDVEREGEAMNQLMDMQSDYNATVSRLAALEEKLESFSSENSTLREELNTVKSETSGGSLADLEAKMNQLSKENEDLYKSLENVEGRTSLADLEARIEKLANDNEALQQSLESVGTETTPLPFADLESKIDKVATENASLREELNAVKSNTEALSLVSTPSSEINTANVSIEDTEAQTDTADSNKSDNTEAAKQAIKNALGGKIDTATREGKDDLTVIKGIGTFIEQKLNAIGIFTYKQISQFDEEMIENVTNAIEFFPGRIKRDDWVGQATRLLDIKKENPDVLKKSIYPDNIEDLKIIEGIGPKIEKILKAASINNWQELADTQVEQLRTILKDAGDRYRIHDPSTWPMQAQMAADWKWTELKDYQDYLVGGRDMK